MKRRQPVSRFSTEVIGITIIIDDVPADPDADAVRVTITREADNVIVVNNQLATQDSVGEYSWKLLSSLTDDKGDYTAWWTYSVGGDTRTFETYFIVVDPQPFWDTLSFQLKEAVENVYHRVSDSFDSSIGGPYLWELPQSSFGFETISRLMVTDAITTFNLAKPKAFDPPFTVAKGAPNPLPAQWYGLLEKITLYSLLRHLCRNYLEQPDVQGVDTSRFDRTKYHNLWCAEADREKVEVEEFIRMVKRKYIYGSKRALLLAGGMFPRSFYYPARPHYPYWPVYVR